MAKACTDRIVAYLCFEFRTPADTGLATSWHHFTWPPPQHQATQTTRGEYVKDVKNIFRGKYLHEPYLKRVLAKFRGDPSHAPVVTKNIHLICDPPNSTVRPNKCTLFQLWVDQHPVEKAS